MDITQVKKLAFYLNAARLLLETNRASDAADALDIAASCIPEEFWPNVAESAPDMKAFPPKEAI